MKPGEDASLYAARGTIARRTVADVAPAGGGRGAPGAGRGGFPTNWGGVFTEMMITDLVPMIERTYRVAPGRENRAMAGLSRPALARMTEVPVWAGCYSQSALGFIAAPEPFWSPNNPAA